MTRKDPLAGLEKVPWQRLGTSGGERATRLPTILRQLAETRDPEAWLEAYTALPSQAYLTHSHGPYVSEACGFRKFCQVGSGNSARLIVVFGV